MGLQNRVTPQIELVADPARGLVYGNRGCLHDEHRRVRRLYAGRRWIACRLQFRGWHRRPLMQPGKFTELFFLDEATAFAAGHRPCALCRRDDYERFLALWQGSGARRPRADDVDAELHRQRLGPDRRQRRHGMALAGLPDGTMVLHDDAPHLVIGSELLRWTPGGYTTRAIRPRAGQATVLTPPALVAVLRDGWKSSLPLVHPSARRGR